MLNRLSPILLDHAHIRDLLKLDCLFRAMLLAHVAVIPALTFEPCFETALELQNGVGSRRALKASGDDEMPLFLACAGLKDELRDGLTWASSNSGGP